jgi:hypothetical protein
MTDEDSEIEVEDKSISTESIALPLRDGNEIFTFYSVADFEAFIETEKEHWKWLASVPAPWSVFSSYLKTQVVDVIVTILSTISSHWKSENGEALNERLTQLENILTFIDFPFSCRKTGKAIAYESKSSNIVAVNMLYLCSAPKDGAYTGEMTTISTQFKTIVKTNQNGRLSTITVAFFDSEVYRLKANRILTKIELFGMDSEVSELVENLSGISGVISDIQRECKESSVELESWKKSKKIEYAEWVTTNRQELRSLGKKLLRKIVSLKTEYLRRSSDTLKLSEKTVDSAKQVYLSQVELAAAVTYWEGKKTTHKESKNMWLKVLIGLLVTTSVSPFLIMKFLPVEELADDKLLLNVLNPITLITSLLVISLLSFSIRLCSRQFSTQQHLFLEAEERKTMLKTYLALMNEGKLVEQEDRKIALDALFRPAQTGMVADHGSIVPSDTVVKIIDRQPVPRP